LQAAAKLAARFLFQRSEVNIPSSKSKPVIAGLEIDGARVLCEQRANSIYSIYLMNLLFGLHMVAGQSKFHRLRDHPLRSAIVQLFKVVK
jgi:hypothetical protein